MKVLHVVTKSSWGGAQKYVVDLVSGFQNDFDQVVAYGHNSFGGLNVFEQKLNEIGIPRRPISHMQRDISLLAELKSVIALWNIVKKEKPDVIHLNSAKAAGLGSAIARLQNVPRIIYTVHGLALSEDRPQWQKKIIALVSWITFKLSTDVIFVSQAERNQVKKWKVLNDKSHVIHNGVGEIDMNNRETARARIEKRFHKVIPNDATVLGGIGELTKNKGQKYLIEALTQLNGNWIYLHWGTGELEQELRNLGTQHNLQERIWFLGFDEQAKQNLSALDIFVLPSIKEGLGYVVLEAGMARLPVVASNVGGVPEIITDQKEGILMEPRNVDALGKSIQNLIDNPEQRNLLASNLHKKVQAEFSLKAMINKTRSVYTG